MPEHQVLLVEHDTLQRMALKKHFDRYDMPCLDCGRGSTALNACMENYYPMILTDFHLPDMTGAELCRGIRQYHHLHKAVVVVMSTDATPNEVDAAFEHGANGFLHKPVSADRVSQWLKATFGLY